MSCKDDEETPEDFLNFSGETYQIINVYKEDDPNWDEDSDKLRHGRFIAVTNGQYPENGSVDSPVLEGSFLLFLEVFTPIESGVPPMVGTYSFVDYSQLFLNEEALEGQNVFSLGTISLNTNGDNNVDDSDALFTISGGSIVLEDMDDSFTISFDLSTIEGQNIKGSFTGEIISL